MAVARKLDAVRLTDIVGRAGCCAGSSDGGCDGGVVSLAVNCGAEQGDFQRVILLILEPSSVKLYIRPLPSKMKPTMGLAILLIDVADSTVTGSFSTAY
jgi:hypothetical protein